MNWIKNNKTGELINLNLVVSISKHEAGVSLEPFRISFMFSDDIKYFCEWCFASEAERDNVFANVELKLLGHITPSKG